MQRITILIGLMLLAAGATFAAEKIRVYSVEQGGYIESEKVVKSPDEWRKLLTPEQFHILREQGTERAFTHPLHDHKGEGVYRCAGCGLDLFSSESKYDSKSGWPSFYAPVAEENVAFADDHSFFMRRVEVLCTRCGGHLGHVFEDGPPPTGLRYCMNGYALAFVPAK